MRPRQLSPEMTKLLREHEESMAAIAADRARWAREGRRPASGSNYGNRVSESVATPWVRPTPRQAPVTPALLRPEPGRKGPARSEPSRVCLVCLTPAFLVVGTLRCQACDAEIRWRVSLARQGLRVVP